MTEQDQQGEEPKQVRNFRSVSIQDELVKQIQQRIRRLGTYKSVAEFVSEAVRLRLEALEKHQKAEGQNEQEQV